MDNKELVQFGAGHRVRMLGGYSGKVGDRVAFTLWFKCGKDVERRYEARKVVREVRGLRETTWRAFVVERHVSVARLHCLLATYFLP